MFWFFLNSQTRNFFTSLNFIKTNLEQNWDFLSNEFIYLARLEPGRTHPKQVKNLRLDREWRGNENNFFS